VDKTSFKKKTKFGVKIKLYRKDKKDAHKTYIFGSFFKEIWDGRRLPPIKVVPLISSG
jgi:hypothetical protein